MIHCLQEDFTRQKMIKGEYMFNQVACSRFCWTIESKVYEIRIWRWGGRAHSIAHTFTNYIHYVGCFLKFSPSKFRSCNAFFLRWLSLSYTDIFFLFAFYFFLPEQFSFICYSIQLLFLQFLMLAPSMPNDNSFFQQEQRLRQQHISIPFRNFSLHFPFLSLSHTFFYIFASNIFP